ncbi:MAG TPA: zinc ribbon domain-containing protein [Anaerolineales bacterium]|nr:zinc ribbon domain-containing protein [Anaerolineales bacterium]
MDIGSIFLILALLVLVGLFVARPLFERKSNGASLDTGDEEHTHSAFLAERDRILNTLEELDFDHLLGKIPSADYPGQRALLVQRGAEVLRQLDLLAAQPATNDLEARIEAAIAARRADAGRRTPAHAIREKREKMEALAGAGNESLRLEPGKDDDLELQLAARRRERPDRSAGFCPNCGRPVQKSDSFCPKCGTPLS